MTASIGRFKDGRDWFFEKRFGLFVHWGLYALTGIHEQVMWRHNIPRHEYELLARRFNPVHFDPDAWLDLAEEARMQYLCFTTKHHDGFCLWDTKHTDYKITQTPYGKDVLRMISDACHRRGFPLCLYYSVVDWHHPNYPNQGRSHELAGPQPGDDPNQERYLVFVKSQIEELCTNYGSIHGFWWDMNVLGHKDESFNQQIRRLQPNAVINDRGFDAGDFTTPEREVPAGRAFSRPTEACESVGQQSWGYRTEEDFHSDLYLMRSMDSVLAMGGNYLLNVGPAPDGSITPAFADIIRRVGCWHKSVCESFDGATPASHLTSNEDVLLTRKGNALYVHCHRGLNCSSVLLKPLQVLPRRATLLNTGRDVEACLDRVMPHWRESAWLCIRGIPVNALQDTVPVFRLEFDALPE